MVTKKETSEERKAMLAKTARLRELRLAKEAEDQKTVAVPPPRKAPVRKAPKRRTPAPWPW
jgi:hypothetical protein